MTGERDRDRLECHKLELEIAELEQKVTTATVAAEVALRDNRHRRATGYEHRIHTLFGGIHESSVRSAIETLAVWARRDPGEPITVVLNSPGGYVMHGLALYDYLLELRELGHHVTMIGLGEVASMGGVLLQAGSTRVMGRNAHMLIHEVSSGAFGKSSEMGEHLEFSKRLEKRCAAILTERSTLTPAQLERRWKKTDWWLDADQALGLGLVDEVRRATPPLA